MDGVPRNILYWYLRVIILDESNDRREILGAMQGRMRAPAQIDDRSDRSHKKEWHKRFVSDISQDKVGGIRMLDDLKTWNAGRSSPLSLPPWFRAVTIYGSTICCKNVLQFFLDVTSYLNVIACQLARQYFTQLQYKLAKHSVYLRISPQGSRRRRDVSLPGRCLNWCHSWKHSYRFPSSSVLFHTAWIHSRCRPRLTFQNACE